MIILQLDHVSRLFGSDIIIEDVCLQVQDNARVGLIGPNGSGKTTLARILAGDLPPSTGSVIRTGSPSTGYLKQTPELDTSLTVWDTVYLADTQLHETSRAIQKLEALIAEGNATDTDMRRYGTLRDQFHQIGGYDYEARCRTTLDRLGFPETMYTQPVRLLSGGQQSRLELAAILLRHPDILILDEPTNHLDIDATEWLESFLASYPGALVVISHDRVFLDKVVNEIVEVERHAATLYPGNYTRYMEQKADREAAQRKAYRLQQDEIRRTEEFVRRNIANVKKTKMAQSRQRTLDRMERITAPQTQRPVNLKFSARRRGGNNVLQIRDLTKSYGENTLFSDVSLTVRRGERLGIVGPNGSGKSTFIRLIVDEEESDTGEVMFGTGIEAGYFDQKLSGLDTSCTVIDEVWSVNPRLDLSEIRSFLGNFLFSEDEQFRIVGTLSGGEQNRVALAKLVLSHMNLLILDEPTNHLDIPSRLVLENALSQFDGTLVLVSHDRALLRNLTNRILWIEDGEAYLYEMGFGSFEEKRAEKKQLAEQNAKNRKTVSDDKAERIAEYERKKTEERERRRLERRLEETETAIADTEEQIRGFDTRLEEESGSSDWTHLQELTESRESARKHLDKLYELWTELEHQRQKAEAEE